LTAKGVWPGRKWLKAASGTIVSWVVLTGEPAEVLPLPVLASALVWALRASAPSVFAAALELVADDDDPGVGKAGLCVTVPATALEVAVPLGLAPAVLT
jgi:hypothetical protein